MLFNFMQIAQVQQFSSLLGYTPAGLFPIHLHLLGLGAMKSMLD
jgi:hypothetical protein